MEEGQRWLQNSGCAEAWQSLRQFDLAFADHEVVKMEETIEELQGFEDDEREMTEIR